MTVVYAIVAVLTSWLLAWFLISWLRTRRLRVLSSSIEAGHRGPPLFYLHPLQGLHGLPGEVPLPPGRYAIGRDETNDIVITSPFVSRHHAILQVGATGVRIQCLPTAKGVFVRRAGTDWFEDAATDEVSIGTKDIVALGRPDLQVWFSLPRASDIPHFVRPAASAEAHRTALMPRDEEVEAATMAISSEEAKGPGEDAEDDVPTFRILLDKGPPSREPAGPKTGADPPLSPPRRGRHARHARPSPLSIQPRGARGRRSLRRRGR